MENQHVKTQPVSDLELYEIIVAAYPDKFDENSDEDIWDDVMDFVWTEFGDELPDLLGRLVYMTNPAQSAISGELHHCIGKVEIKNGQALMTAAAARTVNTQTPTQGQ